MTSLSILLPDSMPSAYDTLYLSGAGSRRKYSLGLSAAPETGRPLRRVGAVGFG
jgi:hypothetical protein